MKTVDTQTITEETLPTTGREAFATITAYYKTDRLGTLSSMSGISRGTLSGWQENPDSRLSIVTLNRLRAIFSIAVPGKGPTVEDRLDALETDHQNMNREMESVNEKLGAVHAAIGRVLTQLEVLSGICCAEKDKSGFKVRRKMDRSRSAAVNMRGAGQGSGERQEGEDRRKVVQG